MAYLMFVMLLEIFSRILGIVLGDFLIQRNQFRIFLLKSYSIRNQLEKIGYLIGHGGKNLILSLPRILLQQVLKILFLM